MATDPMAGILARLAALERQRRNADVRQSGRVRCLFAQTADVTIANTAVETSIVGTGVGILLLPARYWTVGKALRVKVDGYYTSDGAAARQYKSYLGAVAIGATLSTTGGAVSAVGWQWFVDIICRSVGATGTVMVQQHHVQSSSSVQQVATTTTTIDTTVAALLDLRVKWSAGSAGRTLTCTNLTVEALN